MYQFHGKNAIIGSLKMKRTFFLVKSISRKVELFIYLFFVFQQAQMVRRVKAYLSQKRVIVSEDELMQLSQKIGESI